MKQGLDDLKIIKHVLHELGRTEQGLHEQVHEAGVLCAKAHERYPRCSLEHRPCP
jgi:hypothetical protein